MQNKTKVVALALNYPRTLLSITDKLIADGVIRWGKRAGWAIIDLRSWSWQVPPKTKFDGLIYDQDLSNRQKLESLVSEIPFSVRIQPPENAAHTCGVDTDWEAVGLQAAKYYLERGFRSFALAAYRTREWILSLRIFKERIEQAGGQCEAIRGLHIGGSKT